MTMRTCGSFGPVLACLLLAACSQAPVRRPVSAPAARPEPKAQARPPALTAADRKKVERFYYQAVEAYSKDDAKTSDAYLKEIFSIDPFYLPAKELKARLTNLEGAPK